MIDEQKLRQSLKNKGWPEEEINKTMSIMMQGEEKAYNTLMNQMMYWISLIVSIIGNLMVSIMMIPILMAIPGALLYLTIGLIAGTFGLLFDFLIYEIESTQKQTKIIAWLFMPALAAINVVFITVTSNNLTLTIPELGLLQQNPMVISIVYVIPFAMPYIVNKYLREKKQFIINEKKEEYIPKLYQV